MPNVFKNAGAINVGTSFVTVYQSPALQSSMLTQLLGCNLTNSGIVVDVQIFRAAAVQTVNLLKGVPIPAGATIKIIEDDKLVLGPGDEVKIRSSVAASLDSFASLVEDINS